MQEGDSQRPGALWVPRHRFHTGWRVQGAEIAQGQQPAVGAGEGGPSEGDVVLIQRQQQQDGPAAQQAHVVQQEEEPGPLVPHVQHGRELRKR